MSGSIVSQFRGAISAGSSGSSPLVELRHFPCARAGMQLFGDDDQKLPPSQCRVSNEKTMGNDGKTVGKPWEHGDLSGQTIGKWRLN